MYVDKRIVIMIDEKNKYVSIMYQGFLKRDIDRNIWSLVRGNSNFKLCEWSALSALICQKIDSASAWNQVVN